MRPDSQTNAGPDLFPPGNLLLQWHITERCNAHCAHCYQGADVPTELAFPDLLRVLDQYESLLARWRREAGARPVRGHITVTGGEPFLREDFFDLLELIAVKRRSFRFAILTNGSLIDNAVAGRLARLEPALVQVSIEGRRETHDRIRGAGDFDRVIGAMRHLVRRGIRTMISFTAHRDNYREFSDVARLGCDLRVARVWADRLIPCGNGAELRDAVLSPDETREFLEIMRGARRDAHRRWFGRTEISMHRALQFLAGGGIPYRCTAGYSLLTVQSNGNLVPCRRMPVRVGNLLETSLEELYTRSEFLQRLRAHRACHACEECLYARLCRGGLRCLAMAMTGDPFHADPGCWRAKAECRPNFEGTK